MINNQKNMVVISLQGNEDGLSFVFEKEHHYMYEHRRLLYQISLDTTDKEELLQDKLWLKDRGFSIENGLQSNRVGADKRGHKYHALFAYQYEKRGKYFINIDEETYRPKSNREFCASILAKPFKRKIIIEEDNFIEQLGTTLIKHLSINPDEKYEDYKHLVTDFEPLRHEKREA